MSRRLGAILGFALLLVPAHASAVPLGVGDTALSGTTSALRPDLVGLLVAEDLSVPYDFVGAGGEHLVGTIQNRVLLATDGTYDFYWRIRPDRSSTGEITAFRVGGFAGFALDGDFRTDGLGDVGPDTARNFGNGFVNFLFGNGVDPDEESYFFFLDTEATAYSRTGVYDLLCADQGCISDAYETFAPVPEPSTVGLLAAGLVAAARNRIRRRRSS